MICDVQPTRCAARRPVPLTTPSLALVAALVVAVATLPLAAAPASAQAPTVTAVDGSEAPRVVFPSVPTVAAHADLVACEAGDAAACYAMGNRYHGGDGVSRDSAFAVAFVRASCDADHGPACYDLGVRHLLGEYAEQDAAAALRHIGRACDLDYAVACYFAGTLVRGGVGVPRALETARDFFERACTLGYGDACTEVVARRAIVAGGEEAHLAANADPSLHALARMCDHGLEAACAGLADAYLDGRLPQDAARANALREESCDWGYLPACRALGR